MSLSLFHIYKKKKRILWELNFPRVFSCIWPCKRVLYVCVCVVLMDVRVQSHHLMNPYGLIAPLSIYPETSGSFWYRLCSHIGNWIARGDKIAPCVLPRESVWFCRTLDAEAFWLRKPVRCSAQTSSWQMEARGEVEMKPRRRWWVEKESRRSKRDPTRTFKLAQGKMPRKSFFFWNGEIGRRYMRASGLKLSVVFRSKCLFFCWQDQTSVYFACVYVRCAGWEARRGIYTSRSANALIRLLCAGALQLQKIKMQERKES